MYRVTIIASTDDTPPMVVMIKYRQYNVVHEAASSYGPHTTRSHSIGPCEMIEFDTWPDRVQSTLL